MDKAAQGGEGHGRTPWARSARVVGQIDRVMDEDVNHGEWTSQEEKSKFDGSNHSDNHCYHLQ